MEIYNEEFINNIHSKVNSLFNHYLNNEKPIDVKPGNIKYRNDIEISWSDMCSENNKYKPRSPFGKGCDWFSWEILTCRPSLGEFLEFTMIFPLRRYPVTIDFSREDMAKIKTKLEYIFKKFEESYLDKFTTEDLPF